MGGDAVEASAIVGDDDRAADPLDPRTAASVRGCMRAAVPPFGERQQPHNLVGRGPVRVKSPLAEEFLKCRGRLRAPG